MYQLYPRCVKARALEAAQHRFHLGWIWCLRLTELTRARSRDRDAQQVQYRSQSPPAAAGRRRGTRSAVVCNNVIASQRQGSARTPLPLPGTAVGYAVRYVADRLVPLT